jgi:hypothetical protein
MMVVPRLAAIRIFLGQSGRQIAIALLPSFFFSVTPARRAAVPIIVIAIASPMMTVAIVIARLTMLIAIVVSIVSVAARERSARQKCQSQQRY